MDEKLAKLTDDEQSDSEILKDNGVEFDRQNSKQSEKDMMENDDDEDDDDLPTGE